MLRNLVARCSRTGAQGIWGARTAQNAWVESKWMPNVQQMQAQSQPHGVCAKPDEQRVSRTSFTNISLFSTSGSRLLSSSAIKTVRAMILRTRETAFSLQRPVLAA
eukprot:1852069-Pyramimonas_sp.AAC.2